MRDRAGRGVAQGGSGRSSPRHSNCSTHPATSTTLDSAGPAMGHATLDQPADPSRLGGYLPHRPDGSHCEGGCAHGLAVYAQALTAFLHDLDPLSDLTLLELGALAALRPH
jgi:hypothetical protein